MTDTNIWYFVLWLVLCGLVSQYRNLTFFLKAHFGLSIIELSELQNPKDLLMPRTWFDHAYNGLRSIVWYGLPSMIAAYAWQNMHSNKKITFKNWTNNSQCKEQTVSELWTTQLANSMLSYLLAIHAPQWWMTTLNLLVVRMCVYVGYVFPEIDSLCLSDSSCFSSLIGGLLFCILFLAKYNKYENYLISFPHTTYTIACGLYA